MPISKQPTSQNQPNEKNRPAAEFRDSNLRITIWPTAGDDGITRYNVILTRSYQSNGIWKETPYLGKLDLQRAIKLLDRADDWIFNTSAKAREAEAQAMTA